MKPIIFDFDGVIMDSQSAWNAMGLTTYRKSFPHMTPEEDAAMLGKSEKEVYRELLKKHRPIISEEEHWKNVNALAIETYRKAEMMDGVMDLIKRLHDNGVPLAIATSSSRSWMDHALDRLGLHAYFPIISTADDVPFAKPAPDIYLRAAELLDADPRDSIAIEDTETGAMAAVGAGMTCIGYIPHGNTKRVPNAHHHIRHFDEVTDEWLKKL